VSSGSSLSHTHADPNADVGLDRPIDHFETTDDHVMVDAAESAHELVATVAKQSGRMNADVIAMIDDCLQHTIAGGVAIPVV